MFGRPLINFTADDTGGSKVISLSTDMDDDGEGGKSTWWISTPGLSAGRSSVGGMD